MTCAEEISLVGNFQDTSTINTYYLLMTHFLEYSILIRTSPAALYAVYADVGGWHLWDPDTQSAQLNGPLRVGTTGRLKPRKGLAVNMEVVKLEPDKRLIVECPVLGSRMRFDHHIDVIDKTHVRATHQVSFEGWLAGFLYRVVGKDLHHGLPITLKSLKEYIESDLGSTSSTATTDAHFREP